MDIKKSKDGKTNITFKNKKIIYDPSNDSYIICMFDKSNLHEPVKQTVIKGDVLQALYETAWGGKKPNREGYYYCEQHGHEQYEPCPDCKND